MPSLRKTAGDNYLTYWYFNLEGWYVLCVEFKGKIKIKYQNLSLFGTSIIHPPNFIKNTQVVAEERRSVDKK